MLRFLHGSAGPGWTTATHLHLQLLCLLGDAHFERTVPLTARVNDARRLLTVQPTALAACLTCSANIVSGLKLCRGQQQPCHSAHTP